MSRLFGFEIDRGRDRHAAEFDALTRRADEAGVRWRDLVQDGYRIGTDLYAGGMLIRYDWRWRIDELRRRIEEAGGSAPGG